MIQPTEGSESGDFVQQTDQGLETQSPGTSATEALDTFTADFDKQSGVLSITINNRTVRVSGLPTELNLPSGPQGARGKEGKAGTPGRNGRDGATGIQGCAGPKGDRGPKGATGATGERGIQGPIGNAGPTGPTGATGATGTDGNEPEYFAGIRNQEGSHTFTETDDEGNTTQGRSPYIRMIESGAMIEWGRYIQDTGTEEVTVLFSEPFVNRVTSIMIFFNDPYSFQAQNYEIGDFVDVDSDIGGFTIGVKGTFTLPLSDVWDFTWIALGD
jgi:hypothetical protein